MTSAAAWSKRAMRQARPPSTTMRAASWQVSPIPMVPRSTSITMPKAACSRTAMPCNARPATSTPWPARSPSASTPTTTRSTTSGIAWAGWSRCAMRTAEPTACAMTPSASCWPKFTSTTSRPATATRHRRACCTRSMKAMRSRSSNSTRWGGSCGAARRCTSSPWTARASRPGAPWTASMPRPTTTPTMATAGSSMRGTPASSCSGSTMPPATRGPNTITT
ncbi:hypothetical protein D3C86_1214990 [compost metagenome]